MTKPKIAICVTGQIRHFNKHEDRFYEGLDYVFEDMFDYDLYGHTWSDQVLPNTSKFQETSVTNQQDFWKYLVEDGDPFGAMMITNEVRNHVDYQNAIRGKGNLLDVMEKVTTGRWAQILTTHHAFSVIPSNKIDEYSAFVKWRWDITAGEQSDKTLLPKWQKQYYDLVMDCDKNNKNAVITNPSDKPSPSGVKIFEDLMLTFSRIAYRNFVDRSANITIAHMMESGYGNDHSHELWKQLSLYLGAETLEIKDINPIMFLGNEYLNEQVGPNAKSNKQWGV